MLYFIVVLLLINNLCCISEGSPRPTSLKNQKRKPFAALVFSNTNNVSPSDKSSCQWLNRLKHQNKICRNRRGLAETLLTARNLAVTECQHQFKYDQWNCSRREFFLKKMYRETALMYSLASSAVMFAVARACSTDSLAGCTCGEHGKGPPRTANWHWGGCPDNSKFAKKLTKKFLQLRKKGDAIVEYNTEVGIKIVMQKSAEAKDCKCHGVSGSCSLKICVKKIESFSVISHELKILYHNAIQVQPGNKIRWSKSDKGSQKLLYLENSPNFCEFTENRECRSEENCATLCCGRGSDPVTIQVLSDECDCRWRNEKIYDVKCDVCYEDKQIFICK